MKRDVDIVIAGGGMVGAGLAALLGAQATTAALRVVVLEPRPVPLPGPAEPWDLRVSALSRASQRLLELTDAWPRVAQRGAGRYERMVVWDECSEPDSEAALRLDAADIGEPDLGHIVENRTVQAALLERAVACGATVLRTGVAALAAGAETVSVTTGDGRKITAALVVAADGADSTVRRLAGIATRGWEYGQEAVVAHLASSQPHRHTAWQRFLAAGPLALLPLADGGVSLVWSTTPQQAAELTGLDDAAFGARVTEASAGVLGRVSPRGVRARFPLRLLHALAYSGPRVVLAGDAAHGVHPLAGQGANLGFLDGAALAQLLGEAAGQGADPGEPALLRRYERWRKAQNVPAMLLMDGLQRLFSNDEPLLSRARRAGLGLVNRAPPLKRAIMARALGLSGEVPRLLADLPQRRVSTWRSGQAEALLS